MLVGRKRYTIIQQKQYAMRLLHLNGMLEYIIVILAQLLLFFWMRRLLKRVYR